MDRKLKADETPDETGGSWQKNPVAEQPFRETAAGRFQARGQHGCLLADSANAVTPWPGPGPDRIGQAGELPAATGLPSPRSGP